MARRRWVLLALAAAAIVLVAGRAIASIYVEHGWYTSLGLPELAQANLAGALLLRGGSTLIATLFLFASVYGVRRSVVSLVLPRRVGDLEFGEEVPGRYLVATVAVLAIAVGSLLGIDGSHWPRFALGFEGLTFGDRDPYFEHDVGFYVGWLPAELLLFQWAQRLLLVTIFVTLLLYALTPSIRWRGRSLYVSEYVRRHLTLLGGVLLIVFAWAFRLESYQLLLDGSGVGGAFAPVDLQVRVPGGLVLAATSLAAGLLVMWAGVAGQVRLAFFAVTVMLLLTAIVRFVLPVAMRPGSARADAAYTETRDGFTRRAFGADQVVPVGAADSTFVVATVGDVAIWDAPALRRAIDGAAGVGWSATPGGVQAIVAQRGFVADGEMTPWTVTRIAGWTADPAGEPLALRPPAGEFPDVLAPVIAVDTAPRYRIVADPEGVLGAAPAGSGVSRLAHAWALQNFRILLGRQPSPAPRIVLRPQLRDRLAAVVPFFVQGDVARPAVAGDSLFWIVELYTASSTYPLSESLNLAGDERRYFQPAGHAVVNAATGIVRVVPVGAPDPVTRAWMARFPSLFVPPASLPPRVASTLMPHAEAARARALTFARLGRTAREAPPDRRHLVLEHGADSVVAGEMAPLILQGTPGLSVVVPVLNARDQVAGVVVTSGHGSASRWLPAGPQAPRWADVLDALRGADSTSARRDARPVRGRVRVIPTGEGLVFAQPTYIWPARGGPRLAGVATLSQSGARSAAVLDLGGAAPPSRVVDAAAMTPTAVYARLREALRRADGAAFGALLDTLGQVLGTQPR